MFGKSIIIKGRVQGVWYRASAKKKADDIGLTGWVKNLSDGNVLAKVFGTKEQIKKFIEWCQEGPEHADVKEIKSEDCDIEDYPSFSILR